MLISLGIMLGTSAIGVYAIWLIERRRARKLKV